MKSRTRLKSFGVSGTFLDDTHNPSFESADVAVFGVAFDATTSYNTGARFGPSAIMAASHQIEFEIPAIGISLASRVKIHSLGNLEYSQNQTEKKRGTPKTAALTARMVHEVQTLAEKIFREKKLLVGFGGEHSVSNGIFRAMAKQYVPKDITIVHFDAHLDMRDAWDGLQYSHGSVMRRCLEKGFQTVHIGIRDHISEEEAKFIKKTGLANRIFPCATMPQAYYGKKNSSFLRKNFVWNGRITKELTKKILPQIRTPYAYLTIDVDAFDPKDFPGTGTPLPFGLDFSSTQDFLFELILHLKKNGVCLLGFDIQETAPQLRRPVKNYDARETVSTKTEMNAALLIYKLLLWHFLERFSNPKNPKKVRQL
ncbi:MAG: arginase family protein [Candidatus Micrarchaeota archaeon]